MVGCSIRNCKSRSEKGGTIMFFSFPKKEAVANEWLRYCGPKTTVKYGRVCSNHFLSSDYFKPLQQILLNESPRKVRKLKPDALPTLLIDDTSISNQNTLNSQTVDSSGNMNDENITIPLAEYKYTLGNMKYSPEYNTTPATEVAGSSKIVEKRCFFVMPHFKCCVGGCDSTSNTHRLFCMPMNDNLRNLWMSLLVPTNPNLLGLTKDQLTRKRVCERHFDKTQFDYAGVRIRYSYPCLFTEKEIFHGVPLAKGGNFLDEHNYCRSQEQNEDNNNIKEELITMEGDQSQEHDYSIPSTNQPGVCLHDEDCIFANLKTETTEFDFGESETENKQNSAECQPVSEMFEIKKSLQKPTTRNSATQCHITQCSKIASDSFSKTCQNLQNVYETRYQGLLQNIEKLDDKAKAFLLMQLKLAGRKKTARRFSSEDKLLALALMKQSPTGYKLLEEIFTLPHKRTLYRLSEKKTLNAD